MSGVWEDANWVEEVSRAERQQNAMIRLPYVPLEKALIYFFSPRYSRAVPREFDHNGKEIEREHPTG